MESLVFVKTVSLDKFKEMMGVDKLEIMQTLETGALWFKYGNLTGAVSKKGLPKKEEACISIVHPKDEPLDLENMGIKGCSTFALMHKASEDSDKIEKVDVY